MKLIEFTRGGNIFKTLKIGKRAVIENWFKTWAPDVKYEIDVNLNIKVKGFLNFNYSKINSLPDNLHIEGFLNLKESKITSLPDNLYVEGSLSISKAKITFLPNNLYISGWLDIRNTKITFLPDNLYVRGIIFKDF